MDNKTPPSRTSSTPLEKGRWIMKAIERIIEKEIVMTSKTSWWPGWQHANTSNTKAILSFDVEKSKSLTEEQKEKLKKINGVKVNKNWILKIENWEERFLPFNKSNAKDHFRKLLISALEEDKVRVPTKVPRSVKEERLKNKRKVTEKKKHRSNAIKYY